MDSSVLYSEGLVGRHAPSQIRRSQSQIEFPEQSKLRATQFFEWTGLMTNTNIYEGNVRHFIWLYRYVRLTRPVYLQDFAINFDAAPLIVVIIQFKKFKKSEENEKTHPPVAPPYTDYRRWIPSQHF